MNSLDHLIVKLAQNKLPPHKIAQALQLPLHRVSGILTQARRRGVKIPVFCAAPGEPNKRLRDRAEAGLQLPPSVFAALFERARDEGLTPAEQATRILERELLGVQHD